MTTGIKARELRRARGLRIEELCVMAGISIGTAKSIEAGRDVRLGTLRKVADAYGVPITDLLEDVEAAS